MRMDRRAGLLGGIPSLKQLFIDMAMNCYGRNASSLSYCRINITNATNIELLSDKTIFISIFNGYIGIYEWDPVNLTPSTTPLYRSSTSYSGWYKTSTYFGYAHSPGSSNYSAVYAATLLWARSSYSVNIVNQILSSVTATRIAGANASSNQYISYTPSNYSTSDIILVTLQSNLEVRDSSTDTVIKSNNAGISALNGTTRYITGVNESISTIYGGSIIALTAT